MERAKPEDQYDVTEKLGEGGFGVVYAGYDKVKNRQVAIKLVDTQGKLDDALREVELLRMLDHPNIVHVYDHFTIPKQVVGNKTIDLVIIMEYIPGADLYKLSKQDWSIRTQNANQYTDQMLSALAYMHEHCVVHRDIKPENIMIDRDRAVIIDFGLGCKSCDHSNPRCANCEVKISCNHRDITGTPLYFSPDKIRASRSGGEYDPKKDDVWAMGLTLLELYDGRYPFRVESLNVLSNLDAEKVESLLVIDPHINLDIQYILTQMLNPEETYRPSAQDILNLI